MSKQVEIKVASYTDNVDAAVKIFRHYWASMMIFATHLQYIYTPEMMAANGAIAGDDVIKNRQCVSSDPELHAKFAQRIIDAGFNRLYFHSAGPDQYDFIEDYRAGCASEHSGKKQAEGCSQCIKIDTGL